MKRGHETTPDRSADLLLIRRHVVSLGRGIASRWSGERHLEARFKKGREVVTSTDLRVEKSLRSKIGKDFPNDAVSGEELPNRRGRSGWTWVLDPIDGTSNFAAGIPLFSLCVGLLYGRRFVGGVIHDPLRRETFWSWAGRGAFLNRRRLKPGPPGPREAGPTRPDDEGIPTVPLGDCMIAIHASPRPSAPLALHRLRTLLPAARTVRFLGSGSLELAYLAAGRIDAVVWHTEPGRFLHDVAPGLPLVREAGLRATLFGRSASRRLGAGLVAASGGLHDEIVRHLERAAPAPG